MTAIRKTNRQPLKKVSNQKTKVIQLNAFQQPDQVETDTLINSLWNVVQNSLWFHKDFTAKEKEKFKELIAEHFYNGKNSKSNFKELIERICLVKRYVARKRGRYISKPQDFLNIHYPNGLSGTASWLASVNEVRKNVPDYNKGITTFANAILKYIESPGHFTFYKYRRLLIEQKQFDLLQIFNNVIIAIQFGI